MIVSTLTIIIIEKFQLEFGLENGTKCLNYYQQEYSSVEIKMMKLSIFIAIVIKQQ